MARLVAVVVVVCCLIGCSGDDQRTDRSALDCVSWEGQLADPDPASGFESPDLALARQARADERLPVAAAAYARHDDDADMIRFTIDEPGFAAEIRVTKLDSRWFPIAYTVCD